MHRSLFYLHGLEVEGSPAVAGGRLSYRRDTGGQGGVLTLVAYLRRLR